MTAAFLTDAACLDAPPHLFDATTIPDAVDALAYCRGCPVQRECADWVKPDIYHFDGVAAGQVWNNGRPRARRSPISLDPARLAAAGWSPEAIRKAHALYSRGNRTDGIVQGERLYQQLRHIQRKARRSRERRSPSYAAAS
jgi:hypothetical protein